MKNEEKSVNIKTAFNIWNGKISFLHLEACLVKCSDKS